MRSKPTSISRRGMHRLDATNALAVDGPFAEQIIELPPHARQPGSVGLNYTLAIGNTTASYTLGYHTATGTQGFNVWTYVAGSFLPHTRLRGERGELTKKRQVPFTAARTAYDLTSGREYIVCACGDRYDGLGATPFGVAALEDWAQSHHDSTGHRHMQVHTVHHWVFPDKFELFAR